MVPMEGLEPTRPCGHQILSLARLPIPPHRRTINIYGGNYGLVKAAGKSRFEWAADLIWAIGVCQNCLVFV